MKKIVFCIDENYIKPLAVALQSFLQHHIARDYEISVLYSNIESSEKYKFINFFEKSSLKIEFIYIDYDFSWIPVGYHFNSVIFFRLLIPSIFKNENKILYLDSDILFLSNIDEVFDFDLGSNILAAIPRDKIHGIPEYLQGYVKKYFASGFLLFNVNEFIKQDCFNKALFYLRTRHYEMPDQDALNYAVTNSFDVPYRYGMETSFLENEHPGKELKY